MLRYIEETNKWEGLFKRIRKPAKRRRISLIDDDEINECNRITINEGWLFKNYGEKYINNMKTNSIQLSLSRFIMINKGTFMEKRI